MKSITLCCSAGMSTSMLVEKMKKSAIEKNIEVKIEAVAESAIGSKINDTDVILLGPQIRFLKSKIEGMASEKGIPVDVIPMMDYGTMNGEKVLDFALSLIK